MTGIWCPRSRRYLMSGFTMRLVPLCAMASLVLLLAGCGGGSVGPAGTPTERTGTVQFVIHWPDGGSRAIPAETNRVIVFVNGPGILGSVAYVVDKPTFGSSSTINVPVPVGLKRLFSAEARKVDQTEFSDPQRLDVDSPVLRQGLLLGSGIDPEAHDVNLFQTVQAEVVIKEAAQPDPGTTQVTITVNQVLTATFPSVIVLQMIRDQDGNPITNLNKVNFEVIEDGTPAVITDVRTVEEAAQDLSVMLVLDRSGSMAGTPNENLEIAASTFVNLMKPDDSGAVINFSGKNSVHLDQPFTTDKSLLLAAIQGRNASGSTALWKAGLLAANTTAAQTGRKAVILMTDGDDNDSAPVTRDDVINAAKSGGMPIFTVGLGRVDPGLPGVATETGGVHYAAPTSAQLQELYTRIAGQLAGQIQISFISPDPHATGRVRELIVRFRYGSFSGESSFAYYL